MIYFFLSAGDKKFKRKDFFTASILVLKSFKVYTTRSLKECSTYIMRLCSGRRKGAGFE